MDFKKILESFDAVENNASIEVKNSTAAKGSMISILESFYRVENVETVEEASTEWEVKIGNKTYVVTAKNTFEANKKAEAKAKKEGNHGVSAGKIEKVQEDGDLSDLTQEDLEEAIMVSAEGSEAEALLQILKLSGMPAPVAPALPSPEQGPAEPTIDMQDEYANSPDEFEQDLDSVIASGNDLHREKDQFAASAPGDNPMRAFEGKFKSILDELLAEDNHTDDTTLNEMFQRYNIFYDGKLIGQVMAMTHQSALDKGGRLAGVSASAYGGRASRLVKAELA